MSAHSNPGTGWVTQAIGFFVVLGALLGGCYWFLFGAFSPDGMCANELVQRVPSPDKKLEAVVFQRNCGATTDFTTQVSVLPAGQPVPGGAGNVWIADSDKGRARTGPGGGPDVDVVWQDNNHLQLRHDARARVFQTKRAVGVPTGIFQSRQVSVEYVPENPDPAGR